MINSTTKITCYVEWLVLLVKLIIVGKILYTFSAFVDNYELIANKFKKYMS